jgi:hypothetical protein
VCQVLLLQNLTTYRRQSLYGWPSCDGGTYATAWFPCERCSIGTRCQNDDKRLKAANWWTCKILRKSLSQGKKEKVETKGIEPSTPSLQSDFWESCRKPQCCCQQQFIKLPSDCKPLHRMTKFCKEKSYDARSSVQRLAGRRAVSPRIVLLLGPRSGNFPCRSRTLRPHTWLSAGRHCGGHAAGSP